MTREDLCDWIKKFAGYGLNPIFAAIHPNSVGKVEKRIPDWKKYQTESFYKTTFNQPGNKEWDSIEPRIGSYYNGIALICCSSGNLVCFDFDIDSGEGNIYYQNFWRKVDEIYPSLKSKAYIEQTQRGGIHIIFQIDPTIEYVKQTKMVCFSSTETFDFIAGKCYLVVAPSPGYEKISGDLSNLYSLTAEELADLIKIVKSLDNGCGHTSRIINDNSLSKSSKTI